MGKIYKAHTMISQNFKTEKVLNLRQNSQTSVKAHIYFFYEDNWDFNWGGFGDNTLSSL